MSAFNMDLKNPITWLLAPLVAPFALLSGCDEGGKAASTDVDSDSDIDSDSDVDTDTDTDVDTDTDTYTNTGGDLIWAKRAGGNSEDRGESIAALADGASLVTGLFSGVAVFGEGEASETELTDGGIFIAKYNADGSLAWVNQACGLMSSNAIAALADGASLVTGRFGEYTLEEFPAVFGEGEANETELTSAGGPDGFIAKYNSNGTLAWAKRVGGDNDDEFGAIAALADGASLVTGLFSDVVVFGEGEANETELTSASGWETFTAKYNPNGTLAWAKASGNSRGFTNGIAALADGASLVTGMFQGTVVLGEGEANETELIAADGGKDVFIAKYNPNGTLVWAKRAGGNYEDEGGAIAALADGTSLVTGLFSDVAVFGEGEANETELTSAGWWEAFIAKYNSNGTLAWAKRIRGNDWDFGLGITALADGASLATGYFGDVAVFGEGEANETQLTSAGGWEAFIAKYNPNGTLAWAKRAGGDSTDEGRSIAALADGTSLQMIGFFGGVAVFGEGEANETELTSAGDDDMFIAKYSVE